MTPTLVGLYQWASPHGSHGMATIDALTAQGFVTVRESARYEGTWMMVKKETT